MNHDELNLISVWATKYTEDHRPFTWETRHSESKRCRIKRGKPNLHSAQREIKQVISNHWAGEKLQAFQTWIHTWSWLCSALRGTERSEELWIDQPLHERNYVEAWRAGSTTHDQNSNIYGLLSLLLLWTLNLNCCKVFDKLSCLCVLSSSRRFLVAVREVLGNSCLLINTEERLQKLRDACFLMGRFGIHASFGLSLKWFCFFGGQ